MTAIRPPIPIYTHSAVGTFALGFGKLFCLGDSNTPPPRSYLYSFCSGYICTRVWQIVLSWWQQYAPRSYLYSFCSGYICTRVWQIVLPWWQQYAPRSYLYSFCSGYICTRVWQIVLPWWQQYAPRSYLYSFCSGYICTRVWQIVLSWWQTLVRVWQIVLSWWQQYAPRSYLYSFCSGYICTRVWQIVLPWWQQYAPPIYTHSAVPIYTHSAVGTFVLGFGKLFCLGDSNTPPRSYLYSFCSGYICTRVCWAKVWASYINLPSQLNTLPFLHRLHKRYHFTSDFLRPILIIRFMPGLADCSVLVTAILPPAPLCRDPVHQHHM